MARQLSAFGHEEQGSYVSEMYLKQVASTLTKGSAVKIRAGKTWSANPKNKTLVYGEDLHLLNPSQALGLLLHEVGHLKYTTQSPEIKNPLCSRYQNLNMEGLNMLEDKRIEARMKELFPGSREAIELMNERLVPEVRVNQVQAELAYEQAVKEANEQLKDQNLPLFKDAEDLERCANGLTAEQPGSVRTQVAQRVTRGFPNMVNQVLLEAALQYHGQAPVSRYPLKEVPKIAAQVAKIMKDHDVENLKSTQEVQDLWEREIFPLVAEWFTDQQWRNRKGKNPEGGDPGSNPYEYDEKMKRKIENLHDSDPGKVENKRKYGWSYGVLRMRLMPLVKAWAPRFKKILKENEARKFLGRYESGRLNTRALYKARLGDLKVFKRPYESKNKDYSFTLLCDVSGSMMGKPLEQAREAVVLMHEILTFCGIETSVVSFDDNVREARGFADKRVDKDKFHRALGDGIGGGTDLSLALEATVPPLEKQGSLNKVHITITDGGVDSGSHDLLHKAMKRNKDTEYYGIGVGRYCGSLERTFPKDKCFVVHDTKDLAPTLIKIMKRRILQA